MATSIWVYTAAIIGALILVLLALNFLTSGTPSISNPAATALSGALHPPGSNLTAAQEATLFPPVPQWASYQGVINGINGSNTLSASDLKGHVVLLDFWTYSCINCIRTLPYLEAFEKQYGPQGLVVVGFHSPEFDFEKIPANVQAAVTQYNLTYPIVLDGDHQIWDLFGNSYWPHEYVVDCNGYIREDHIGEGGYNDTEATIRELLSECNSTANLSSLPMANISQGETVDFSQSLTPELYLGGNERRQPLGNDGGNPTQPNTFRTFTLPASLTPNSAYLNGTWLDAGDHMQLLDAQGDIALTYTARSVYLVASADSPAAVPSNAPAPAYPFGAPPPGTAYLTATIDGQPATSPDANANGTVVITGSRLYRVSQTADYGTHTLDLHISGANFSAYSFTFG